MISEMTVNFIFVLSMTNYIRYTHVSYLFSPAGKPTARQMKQKKGFKILIICLFEIGIMPCHPAESCYVIYVTQPSSVLLVE